MYLDDGDEESATVRPCRDRQERRRRWDADSLADRTRPLCKQNRQSIGHSVTRSVHKPREQSQGERRSLRQMDALRLAAFGRKRNKVQ